MGALWRCKALGWLFPGSPQAPQVLSCSRGLGAQGWAQGLLSAGSSCWATLSPSAPCRSLCLASLWPPAGGHPVGCPRAAPAPWGPLDLWGAVPLPQKLLPHEFPETRFHLGELFSFFLCSRNFYMNIVFISVLRREWGGSSKLPGMGCRGVAHWKFEDELPEVSARSWFTRCPPDAGKGLGAWALGVGQAEVGSSGSCRRWVSVRRVTSAFGGDMDVAGSPRPLCPAPTAGLGSLAEK